MEHKLLISLLALAIGSGATAQNTMKLTAAKHNDYGVVYSLPSTHLNIQVEAIQTIKKAGPFYNYAKKYLGTDNVITKDSQTWDFKNVTVSSFGVPDKDNQYLMQFKSGSAPFLLVTKEGLPLSINTENIITEDAPKFGMAATPTVLDNNQFVKSLPGELLVSESLAKRAEIAANLIYKIRESRTNYATGEADQMPPDGEAMKLIMKQLDEQEAALTALFLGTTTTATAVGNFEYVPTGDVKDEVIMRISDFNGIAEKTDLSGKPLYLSLQITAKGTVPVDEKGEEKKLPKGAVMYKIPGQADVTLKFEGKQVYSGKFDIAQFGIDYGLNPSLFSDKKQPSYLKFYPSTGGIKEIGNASPSSNEE